MGLLVLALIPILVLGIGGGHLVATNMERTMETSLRVQVGLAAQEAAWGRTSVSTVLDSMSLYPPEDNPALASFLAKGGGKRIRVAFAARLDPQGRPALLWPPTEASAVAAASHDLGSSTDLAAAEGWTGPLPDGRGGTRLVRWQRSPQGTDIAAMALGLLENFLDNLRLAEGDMVAIFDQDGSLIALSRASPLAQANIPAQRLFAAGKEQTLRVASKSYLAFSAPVPDSPWKAIYYRESSFLSPFYRSLLLRMGGAIAAAALLAILFGLRIRRDLARPLEDILGKMRAVAQGNYDLRVSGDYPPELAGIAETFNLMATGVGCRDKELQESEERYRSLFHDNPVPALLIEPDLGIIRGANPAAVDFYGYTLEELETVTIQGVSAQSAAELFAELSEAKKTGNRHHSLKHRMKNGSIRDVEIYSNPISLGGRSYHYVLIFDVTSRRVAQDQLEKALEEKVVLLKEIHHRVKNNLQIVASLLNLQIRHIKNPEDRELFRTSQNRVYSMSLTHELLYQADDLSSVNMAEYGQRLLAYLRDAQQQADTRIETDFGHFILSLDKALPCGLILNELITNAIKYASPTSGGPIRVSMQLVVEGSKAEVKVEVTDHGPGLPPDSDPLNSATLGFSLISSLAHQLEGHVEWTVAYPGAERPGTRASLSFPFDRDGDTTGDTRSS